MRRTFDDGFRVSPYEYGGFGITGNIDTLSPIIFCISSSYTDSVLHCGQNHPLPSMKLQHSIIILNPHAGHLPGSLLIYFTNSNTIRSTLITLNQNL